MEGVRGAVWPGLEEGQALSHSPPIWPEYRAGPPTHSQASAAAQLLMSRLPTVPGVFSAHHVGGTIRLLTDSEALAGIG